MLHIFEDKAQLSNAAAAFFVQAAQDAVQQRGRFTVALTGGSSPDQLYVLLTQSPWREQVPWQHVHVFWGDERWVPLTDDRSNAKMAIDILLKNVPVPQEQILPMWSEGIAPEAFAQQYEQLLRQHFGAEAPRFDLILLGMGDDGHTASLFPGTEVLQEQSRWVQAYYLEPQSMYRITLTAPLINQARNIAFITSGNSKAKALFEVLEGARNPHQYPAQLIHVQDGVVHWFTDKEATAMLKRTH